MYERYYSPDSASFAAHWMLIEIDAPYVLHRVDLAVRAHKAPDYLRLNPDGLVPTLLIDGQPRAECAALLLTLADRRPTAQMAPVVGSPERVDYYQWAFYCANSLLPAFRRWFYPVEAAGAAAVHEVQEKARAPIEQYWRRMDRLLSDGRRHFVGDG